MTIKRPKKIIIWAKNGRNCTNTCEMGPKKMNCCSSAFVVLAMMLKPDKMMRMMGTTKIIDR